MNGPPHDERRPGGGGAGVDWTGDEGSVLPITALARYLLDRVYPWHRREDIPRYGTSQWNALADQDPRRAASVIIAAESWRNYTSPEQVAREMAAEVLQDRWELRQASLDVSRATDWAAVAARPTQAELQQRRGAA